MVYLNPCEWIECDIGKKKKVQNWAKIFNSKGAIYENFGAKLGKIVCEERCEIEQKKRKFRQ